MWKRAGPPMRGTSGSVQRRPANPARTGREQRYRDHAVCRGVPEVPLIAACEAAHEKFADENLQTKFEHKNEQLPSHRAEMASANVCGRGRTTPRNEHA